MAALPSLSSLSVNHAACIDEQSLVLTQQAGDCYLASALLAAIRVLKPSTLAPSAMQEYLLGVEKEGTFSCTVTCNRANDDAPRSKAPRVSIPIQTAVPEFTFHYMHFRNSGIASRCDPAQDSSDDEEPKRATCMARFTHTSQLPEPTTEEQPCSLDCGGAPEPAFLAAAACLGVEYTYCDIRVEGKGDVPLLKIPTTHGFRVCMNELQTTLIDKMGDAMERRCMVKMAFSGYGWKMPVSPTHRKSYDARGFNVTDLDDFHSTFMHQVKKMNKVTLRVECYLVGVKHATVGQGHAILAVPCVKGGDTKLLICNSWGIPCYLAEDAKLQKREWEKYFGEGIVEEIACVASARKLNQQP